MMDDRLFHLLTLSYVAALGAFLSNWLAIPLLFRDRTFGEGLSRGMEVAIYVAAGLQVIIFAAEAFSR